MLAFCHIYPDKKSYLILLFHIAKTYQLSLRKIVLSLINVRNKHKGQSRMNNPKTHATLGTRHRTRTKITKNTTQKKNQNI